MSSIWINNDVIIIKAHKNLEIVFITTVKNKWHNLNCRFIQSAMIILRCVVEFVDIY